MIPGFEVFENPTIQLGIITAVTNFIAEIPFVYLAIPIVKPVSMAFPGLFTNRKSE